MIFCSQRNLGGINLTVLMCNDLRNRRIWTIKDLFGVKKGLKTEMELKKIELLKYYACGEKK